MKTLNQDTRRGVAQGEILLIPVNEIPDDAHPINDGSGYHIVAHSETGHHHRFSSDHVYMFRMDDNFSQYIDVQETSVLEHLREEHNHAPYKVEPGKYLVRTARESILKSKPSGSTIGAAKPTQSDLAQRFRMAAD